jgi:hypothetical protein
VENKPISLCFQFLSEEKNSGIFRAKKLHLLLDQIFEVIFLKTARVKIIFLYLALYSEIKTEG